MLLLQSHIAAAIQTAPDLPVSKDTLDLTSDRTPEIVDADSVAGQRRIAPAFVQDARGNVLRPQPLPSAFIALSLGVRRYPLGILLQQPFGLKCA